MVEIKALMTDTAAEWVKHWAKQEGTTTEEFLGRLVGGAALWALQFGSHSGDWLEYIIGSRPNGFIDVSL